MNIVCLFVSEGKERPLFPLADVHKTSCNIQQLSFQRAIVNFSYYLPFKMANSGYQTLCHVRLPVSDISKSLPHSLVKRQAYCGTAGHCSVLLSQVLFSINNFPISTSLLRSLYSHVSPHPMSIHIHNISLYILSCQALKPP